MSVFELVVKDDSVTLKRFELIIRISQERIYKGNFSYL